MKQPDRLWRRPWPHIKFMQMNCILEQPMVKCSPQSFITHRNWMLISLHLFMELFRKDISPHVGIRAELMLAGEISLHNSSVNKCRKLNLWFLCVIINIFYQFMHKTWRLGIHQSLCKKDQKGARTSHNTLRLARHWFPRGIKHTGQKSHYRPANHHAIQL